MKNQDWIDYGRIEGRKYDYKEVQLWRYEQSDLTVRAVLSDDDIH